MKKEDMLVNVNIEYKKWHPSGDKKYKGHTYDLVLVDRAWLRFTSSGKSVYIGDEFNKGFLIKASNVSILK